jgi:hypothetical protein
MNLQESIRRIISEYTEELVFIFDPKTNKVIGFNLVYGSKEFNNIRYDKSGRSGGYEFGSQKDSFNNPIKFDSLEDAQKWYSDKTEKQLQKQTQNQKYSDLSYIAYNIRKIDDLDYQVINRGSCFKFAKEISKLGYDKFTFIFSEEDQEVIHVYVKLTNNLYFDANGFHTNKEIKNQYYVGEDTEMYDSDIDELGNFSDLDTYECLTTIPIPDNVWKKVTQVINKSKSNQQELDEYARTLKNARQQGVGLRFPKSVIKSNPSRFRPYNRKGVNESDLETNQKGMKTMFGKKYPNCVKNKKSKTNLQESIRRILREETSLQSRVNELINTKGVVLASTMVGGLDTLSKILNLDLNDVDTQEKLVKNFINFYDLNEESIIIYFLEVRTAASGGKIIKVNGTVTDDWENFNSWYVLHICGEMERFFPFKTQPAGYPVFASRGVKIFIDSEFSYEETLDVDDEEIVINDTEMDDEEIE